MKPTHEIITGDYCTGCGACVAAFNCTKIESAASAVMKETEFGQYYPSTDEANLAEINTIIDEICPFSHRAPSTDELAKELFGGNSLNYTRYLGYHHEILAGHVKNIEHRQVSSGGGILSELASYLINENEVDFVVHTGPTQKENELFAYGISSTEEEVRDKTGSHYYPTSMDAVLMEIQKRSGNYAAVGVPCFLKAIKNASKAYKIPEPKYSIGIVCGHLKTKQFAEMIIKRTQPSGFSRRVHFRITDPKARANEYQMGSEDIEGQIRAKSVQVIPGSNWGESTFKLNGCDYCDDVYNETADVTFGDAWLDKYISEGTGDNIIVVRSKKIFNFIDKLANAGKISVEKVSPDDAVKAQDATIRHRIHALPHRLQKLAVSLKWVPPSRGLYKKPLSSREILIQDLRTEMTVASKKNFATCKSLMSYDLKMWPLRRRYLNLYKPQKYRILPVEIYRSLQIAKFFLNKVKKSIKKIS